MKTEFLTALFALQGELVGVTKDSVNAFFSKGDKVARYADRSTVLDYVKPFLQKHGFVLVQPTEVPPAHVSFGGEFGSLPLALTTTLYHVATGESVSSTAIVPLQKNDPQGYASAITYASRISLVALLALPLLDDDDGNAASGRAPAAAAKAPTTKAVPSKKDSGGPAKTSASSSPRSPEPAKDATTSETKTATPTPSADATPATTTAGTAAAPEKTASPASNGTSNSKPKTKGVWG